MSVEIPVKKILVLSANPRGTKPLRLSEEIREIKEGLQLAKKRDSFQIESAEAVRDIDIHRSILNYEPQIIHFSGHGAGEEGLIFEDNTGQQKLVDAAALAGLFELFASDVECVLLNACYSQIQAKAIAQHINYVIGMSQEIGDKAAIKFAVGFYDALFCGKDVEFAYKLGCNAIRVAGIQEHLTPQLLKKEDLQGESINTTPVLTSTPAEKLRQQVEAQKLQRQREQQKAEQKRQEHENNLRRYQQELLKVVQAQYPLDEFVRNKLKKFQQSLGLKNKDVAQIEKPILDNKEVEYQEKLRQQQAEKRRQREQQEAQRVQGQKQQTDDLPSEKGVDYTKRLEFLKFQRVQGQKQQTDDLSSAKGIDYTKLRDLLAAGKWKDANEETLAVMLKAAGREKEGYIESENIENFPCTDLRTIDQLWIQYSKGLFGFSVQKRIFETCKSDYYSYEKFYSRVGWRIGWKMIELKRLERNELTFSLNAPQGHLPHLPRDGAVFSLLKETGRLVKCNI